MKGVIELADICRCVVELLRRGVMNNGGDEDYICTAANGCRGIFRKGRMCELFDLTADGKCRN